MSTSNKSRRDSAGFTLVEIMVSMTVFGVVMSMCLGTFLFGLRAMYKDTQRLATNASLRSFMAQVSKETLDASYFYVFPYYTKLDGSVSLSADPAAMSQIENAADDDYDKWVGQGDCLVLDHSGCVHRHGFAHEKRAWSLAGHADLGEKRNDGRNTSTGEQRQETD